MAVARVVDRCKCNMENHLSYALGKTNLIYQQCREPNLSRSKMSAKAAVKSNHSHRCLSFSPPNINQLSKLMNALSTSRQTISFSPKNALFQQFGCSAAPPPFSTTAQFKFEKSFAFEWEMSFSFISFSHQHYLEDLKYSIEK